MTKLVKFDVGDGQTVLIEVEEVKSEEIKACFKIAGRTGSQGTQNLE
ncbi:hypothetical protein COO91_01859 [Nostoc flagelliforme CCNUN1]|uniref:Uncharacterized protein n=1 Tax=Nostoc flagelliforme CCNUN1 TaxID=2038116 RepID=A0A2K8SKE3_9NOSO|nr:hypothetical protein [Nostoc flagelliforme]AUB35966.1 hypothetical protein COO91_01859 [Nostoc flagelliforme CCNUN1]